MEIQDGTAKFRVRNKGADRVPTGIVEFFAGSKAPKGWLVCDGSAISRTEYDELFGVIGTTYGTGDGSTTFNLPNLIDRFAEGGKSVGTKKEAGLPNITGTFRSLVWTQDEKATGAVNEKNASYAAKDLNNLSTSVTSGGGIYNTKIYNFDASRSNPIYGSSDTVQPPSLVLLPIIKY